MINNSKAFVAKHGLELKGNGANRVGVYYGDSTPDLEDDGTIDNGSVYIRTNGEMYQKNFAGVWNLKQAGGSASGTGVNTEFETIDGRLITTFDGWISNVEIIEKTHFDSSENSQYYLVTF